MELKQKASLTGFRALYILNILFKNPSSKEEILKELHLNKDLQNKISSDTVKNDISTLKSAGFDIINTGRAGGYKYKINDTPIKFSLTQRELKTIARIRNALLETADLNYVLNLYKLFLKISNYINDDSKSLTKSAFLDFGFILSINFQTLHTLNALAKRKRRVELLYKSPSYGLKTLIVDVEKIKYRNRKIYLIGKSEYYNHRTILRLDNIQKIIKILPPAESKNTVKKVYKALYKINPECKEALPQNEEAKILQRNKKFILIEEKYDNEFLMVQKLLALNTALLSIETENIRLTYQNTLKNTLKLYAGDS